MSATLAPSLDDLLAVVRARYPAHAVAEVERTYAYAAAAHGERKRFSGDPYITHPTATAILLADMQLALPVVQAGLLHDVLEDTAVTVAEIREEFGDDIATMVANVTKLGTVKYRGVERYVENLRRMFLAMAADVRVVFIKFSDRIHNLRTLDAVPEQKRRRIALESLDLYAPIANRLGMGEIRGELEDLAFRYVLPTEHAWVTSLMRERLGEKTRYAESLKRTIQERLAAAGIRTISLNSRTKHLYSLYKKLLARDRDITRVHDLVAVRIIVPTLEDCYAALGVIHGMWKPLKGRIKDYIAQPKPNGYQSLHTTVFCEDGEIVEIQIRTPEMHRAAEYGVAAHWRYVEAGKRTRTAHPKEVAWMQDFAKIQKEIEDHRKFLENLEALKIEVFENRIFVFTPRGDVIDLPEAATPVDFAYAIHTDIGNKCGAAKVNDEIVSLDTPLKSGDMVEIVTDRNRKAPNQNWLAFVKTRQARDRIRMHAKSGVGEWIRRVVNDRASRTRKNP